MSPAVAQRTMAPAPSDFQQTDRQPAPRQKVLISDVNFYYGAFQALKNITMSLQDKRVFWKNLTAVLNEAMPTFEIGYWDLIRGDDAEEEFETSRAEIESAITQAAPGLDIEIILTGHLARAH